MRIVHLNINGQIVGIPSDLIAVALLEGIPGFLTGDAAPNGMQQAAMKSAVKALIPMALAAMHKEIEQKRLPIMPPDLKCPAAKANIVKYALSYLMATAFAIAEQSTFVAEGGMTDGTFVITSFTTTAALASPASATVDGPTDVHRLDTPAIR